MKHRFNGDRCPFCSVPLILIDFAVTVGAACSRPRARATRPYSQFRFEWLARTEMRSWRCHAPRVRAPEARRDARYTMGGYAPTFKNIVAPKCSAGACAVSPAINRSTVNFRTGRDVMTIGSKWRQKEKAARGGLF
jgi:hypothetical protein